MIPMFPNWRITLFSVFHEGGEGNALVSKYYQFLNQHIILSVSMEYE